MKDSDDVVEAWPLLSMVMMRLTQGVASWMRQA